MNGEWTCAHCGIVIGVYEPAVVVDSSGERLTSRVSEPLVSEYPRACYHAACREGPTREEG